MSWAQGCAVRLADWRENSHAEPRARFRPERVKVMSIGCP